MGQYWKFLNLDRKEFVELSTLGLLKLTTLMNNPAGGAVLVMLCASHPEARGGGDIYPMHDPVYRRTVGRWAGNRIILIGDYARADDQDIEDWDILYEVCEDDDARHDVIMSIISRGEADLAERYKRLCNEWRNITQDVLYVLRREVRQLAKREADAQKEEKDDRN